MSEKGAQICGGTAPLELVHQKRGTFGPSPLVTNRVFDLNLIKNSTVIQLDKQCIAN